MKKIFANNDSRKHIAYHNHISSKNKAPTIIFSHGFMSDQNSSKALLIEDYCVKNDLNYIRYDNFGSGESSGEFLDQTISSWLEGLNMVIDQLASNNVILVGSSKGGWLTLLAAMVRKEVVKGVVNIATATDFTEEVIWGKLSPNKQQEMQQKGVVNVQGKGDGCNSVYPVSYKLIEDGRKHLLLNKEEIEIGCPVHLIHGMNDIDVPYIYSMRTADKLHSKQVVTKLIKDGDHRLARPQDIRMVTNSLEEILDLGTRI